MKGSTHFLNLYESHALYFATFKQLQSNYNKDGREKKNPYSVSHNFPDYKLGIKNRVV